MSIELLVVATHYASQFSSHHRHPPPLSYISASAVSSLASMNTTTRGYNAIHGGNPQVRLHQTLQPDPLGARLRQSNPSSILFPLACVPFWTRFLFPPLALSIVSGGESHPISNLRGPLLEGTLFCPNWFVWNTPLNPLTSLRLSFRSTRVTTHPLSPQSHLFYPLSLLLTFPLASMLPSFSRGPD